jgi:hypothetical protein
LMTATVGEIKLHHGTAQPRSRQSATGPNVAFTDPHARRQRMAGFTILNWPSERPVRTICTGCAARSMRFAVKAPKQSATRGATQLSSAVPISASAIPSILARQVSLSSQGLGMSDAP